MSAAETDIVTSDQASAPGRAGAARARSVAWSCYALILVVLFYRLFLGEMLRPGATINDWIPFQSVYNEDWGALVSDVHHDVWRQFALYDRYQYQAARAGRFPTWNPHVYCGTPLHGNYQSAMLHPLHWPNFFVDPDWARGPLTLLKLWLAAVGMFLLGRRLGLDDWGSFIAGLVWMLGSFHVRWLAFRMINVTCWLPFLLLALDNLIQRPSWRRLGLAALAATVFQLSGHPETQFLWGVVAGVFVLARLAVLPASLKGRLGRGILSLVAMLMGTVGAAAALLPFLAVMLDSADWHQATHTVGESLPVKALMLYLSPDLMGRPRARFDYEGPLNYNETACWFGLLPLALALCTMAFSWSRTICRQRFAAAFCSVLILICLAAVFGLWPVASLLRQLPLFEQCNLMRLLCVIQFAGALLAGIGFEKLFDPSRLAYQRTTLIVFACFTGLIGPLLLTAGPQVVTAEPDLRALLHHPTVRFQVSFWIAATTAVVLLALLGRPQRTRSPGMIWKVVVAFLIVVDLAWVAWDFTPIGPRKFVDPAAPPALQDVLGRLGSGRLTATSDILSPNLAMRYGFRDIRGYEYPQSQRLHTLLGRLGLASHITRIPYERIFPHLDRELATFMNRCGVRILYTDHRQMALRFHEPDDGECRNWPLAAITQASDAIYMNPNAYPRAWLAESVTIMDAEAALEALLEPRVDLRQRSAVEWLPVGGELPEDARGTVSVSEPVPEQVILSTESETGGLVVLADRLEEGWTVTVDGRPAPVLRANFLFRGVLVPAGTHEIRWTYRCPGLLPGSILSLTMLTAIVAMLLVSPASKGLASKRNEKTIPEEPPDVQCDRGD